MKEKLLKIQQELKAPKNQRNNFGGYNYRSCEDILEAVKPILKEENLVLTLNDELVYIGNRYYIKATATLYDCDSKDSISNTAYAREEETKKGMDGSQITGASSSYARKYALNGLFLIDDVKDSDATNTGEEKTTKRTTKEISKEHLELISTLKDLANKKNADIEKVKAYYKVNSLVEMTDEQLNEAITSLEKR